MELANERRNNFDALRILAAMAVLLSHAVPLTDGTDRAEPIAMLSAGQTTGGSIAVTIFFVMSGALVTSSFLRAGSPTAFVAFRALRILPALWFLLPVLAFVVGPLVSSEPIGRYLASPEPYVFVARNMVFLHIENLPGVFAGNPFPFVMDGPLWTLRYEIACYGLVLLLGVCGLMRMGPVLAIYAAALAACLHWPADVRPPLACMFFAGALIQLTVRQTRPWLAALCAVEWCLSLLTSHYVVLACVLAPYPILALARSSRKRLPRLARYGDVSYGLYIYAFPIQQITARLLGQHGGWATSVMVATPAALMCAFASWRFIEQPALRLKKGVLFSRRTAELPLPG